MRTIGDLQLDPLQVVARAQDIALAGRVIAESFRCVVTARDPATVADLAALDRDRVLALPLDVTIAEVKGRAVSFEIAGRDSVEPICRGRHQRFIVDVATTEKRLAAKAAKAGLAG